MYAWSQKRRAYKLERPSPGFVSMAKVIQGGHGSVVSLLMWHRYPSAFDTLMLDFKASKVSSLTPDRFLQQVLHQKLESCSTQQQQQDPKMLVRAQLLQLKSIKPF